MHLADDEGVVAVGLLSRHDLALLGPGFDRLYPVLPDPGFADLLIAIDEADDRFRAQKAEFQS